MVYVGPVVLLAPTLLRARHQRGQMALLSCPGLAATFTPRNSRVLSRPDVASKQGVRAAAGAAVLEPQVEREEAAQTAARFSLHKDWEQDDGFANYAKATERLTLLQEVQQELLSNVAQIDQRLGQPTPSQARRQRQAESKEARSARRQQERASRRMGTSAEPVATATSSTTQRNNAVQQLETQLEELKAPFSELNAFLAQPPSSNVAAAASPSAAGPAPAPTPKQRTQRTPRKQQRSAVSVAAPPPAGQAPPVQTALPKQSPPSQPHSLPQPPIAADSTPSFLGLQMTGQAKQRHAARASRHGRGTSTSEGTAAASSKGKASASGSDDAMSRFMRSAGSNHLLGTDQQREIALVVKDYLWLESVQRQLQDILKRPPTLAERARAVNMDTKSYEERYLAGQYAKSMMLKSNYRLVISVVKRYRGRGMSLQDLITEGMQGLLRGVEKYDADKGFRFSTYAHWWIRQAVMRGVQEQGRTIRLPSHVHEQLQRIVATQHRLRVELQRDASLEEVSQAVGLTEDKVSEILSAASAAGSLEVPALAGGDGSASELKDMIMDERLTPDEAFSEEMIRKNLEEALNELSPREAGILRMRLGLDGVAEATLEDIGEHFQVTRERIRQIEAKAFQKLAMRQHASSGVVHELHQGRLQGVEAGGSSTTSAARSSRGTKKT